MRQPRAGRSSPGGWNASTRWLVPPAIWPRFIVFGSFITTKAEPNDVDIFLLMEDSFEVNKASAEARLVFDHTAAQNLLGASVFWLRRAAALGGEAATIAHWQIKRDGGKRGIVEVTKI